MRENPSQRGLKILCNPFSEIRPLKKFCYDANLIYFDSLLRMMDKGVMLPKPLAGKDGMNVN